MVDDALDVVTDEGRLRELLGGYPAEGVRRKKLDRIDESARDYLACSPFCVMATSDEHGNCDATPRGDDPGFALVLDEHTLVLPERPGNKLADSLVNLLHNPHVGLVFAIPGVVHTLRINGRARIVAGGEFSDRLAAYGKPPRCAIVVDVRECYFHCGKAMVRSQLWDADTWPETGTVPTLGRVLRSQTGIDEQTAAGVDYRGTKAYRPEMF
jgi:hypothetical protein